MSVPIYKTMDNPNPTHSSKRFRWVGRLSEEELLGLPPAARPRRAGAGRPRPAPRPVPAHDTAVPEIPVGRRIHVRDVLTVTALGLAAWFAFQAAGVRSPFHQSSPVGTPTAAEVTVARLGLDRRELASLPRRAGAATEARGSTSPRNGGGPSAGGGSGSKGSNGSNDDPTPPSGETEEPPLVQATIPGVGSVTVEQPDLSLTDETPTLPDLGDTLPPAPSLPLP